MPRCKYRYYVVSLPCNQFHWGDRGTALTGACPLATPKNRLWKYGCITTDWNRAKVQSTDVCLFGSILFCYSRTVRGGGNAHYQRWFRSIHWH